MKLSLLVVTLLAFVSTRAKSTPTPHQPVVAWYVNHDLRHWETVDKSRITHLFFSDRHIQVEQGNCYVQKRKLDDESGGINEDYAMPQLVKYREQYKFKIVLMLGGWGGSNVFGHCAHPSRRIKFIDNLVDYLDEYDFDGVDLDWEHIGIGGACQHEGVFADPQNLKGGCWMTKEQVEQRMKDEKWNYHDPEDWANFLSLIKELRVKLDELGKKKDRRLIITSAMSISGQSEGCQGRVDGIVYKNAPEKFQNVPCTYPDWSAICSGLDLLNVMLYDVWGPWAGTTGHHAAFDCDPNEPLMQQLSPPFKNPCEPRFTVKNAVNWWLNPWEPEGEYQHVGGGCAPEKILLGMPLYGKSLCETEGLYKPGKECNAETPNIKKIGPIGPTIKDINSHGYYLSTPQYFFNATSADGRLIASYYYNKDTKHYVTYDSPELIYEKTKWSAEKGIGGYFFWSAEMDFDHLAADKAFAGWYAGKKQSMPDGVNLDGETFGGGQCKSDNSSATASVINSFLVIVSICLFLL